MNKENKTPKKLPCGVAPKSNSKCQSCRNPQPVYRTCFKCDTSSMYYCAKEDCWGILNAMKHSNPSKPMWICLNCNPKPLNPEEKKFWLPAPNESVKGRIEEEILDAMSTSVYGEDDMLRLEKNTEEDVDSMGFVAITLDEEEPKLDEKKRSPLQPVKNVKFSMKNEEIPPVVFQADSPGSEKSVPFKKHCV